MNAIISFPGYFFLLFLLFHSTASAPQFLEAEYKFNPYCVGISSVEPATAELSSTGNWLVTITFSEEVEIDGYSIFFLAAADIAEYLNREKAHYSPYEVASVFNCPRISIRTPDGWCPKISSVDVLTKQKLSIRFEELTSSPSKNNLHLFVDSGVFNSTNGFHATQGIASYRYDFEGFGGVYAFDEDQYFGESYVTPSTSFEMTPSPFTPHWSNGCVGPSDHPFYGTPYNYGAPLSYSASPAEALAPTTTPEVAVTASSFHPELGLVFFSTTYDAVFNGIGTHRLAWEGLSLSHDGQDYTVAQGPAFTVVRQDTSLRIPITDHRTDVYNAAELLLLQENVDVLHHCYTVPTTPTAPWVRSSTAVLQKWLDFCLIYPAPGLTYRVVVNNAYIDFDFSERSIEDLQDIGDDVLVIILDNLVPHPCPLMQFLYKDLSGEGNRFWAHVSWGQFPSYNMRYTRYTRESYFTPYSTTQFAVNWEWPWRKFSVETDPALYHVENDITVFVDDVHEGLADTVIVARMESNVTSPSFARFQGPAENLEVFVDGLLGEQQAVLQQGAVGDFLVPGLPPARTVATGNLTEDADATPSLPFGSDYWLRVGTPPPTLEEMAYAAKRYYLTSDRGSIMGDGQIGSLLTTPETWLTPMFPLHHLLLSPYGPSTNPTSRISLSEDWAYLEAKYPFEEEWNFQGNIASHTLIFADEPFLHFAPEVWLNVQSAAQLTQLQEDFCAAFLPAALTPSLDAVSSVTLTLSIANQGPGSADVVVATTCTGAQSGATVTHTASVTAPSGFTKIIYSPLDPLTLSPTSTLAEDVLECVVVVERNHRALWHTADKKLSCPLPALPTYYGRFFQPCELTWPEPSYTACRPYDCYSRTVASGGSISLRTTALSPAAIRFVFTIAIDEWGSSATVKEALSVNCSRGVAFAVEGLTSASTAGILAFTLTTSTLANGAYYCNATVRNVPPADECYHNTLNDTFSFAVMDGLFYGASDVDLVLDWIQGNSTSSSEGSSQTSSSESGSSSSSENSSSTASSHTTDSSSSSSSSSTTTSSSSSSSSSSSEDVPLSVDSESGAIFPALLGLVGVVAGMVLLAAIAPCIIRSIVNRDRKQLRVAICCSLHTQEGDNSGAFENILDVFPSQRRDDALGVIREVVGESMLKAAVGQGPDSDFLHSTEVRSDGRIIDHFKLAQVAVYVSTEVGFQPTVLDYGAGELQDNVERPGPGRRHVVMVGRLTTALNFKKKTKYFVKALVESYALAEGRLVITTKKNSYEVVGCSREWRGFADRTIHLLRQGEPAGETELVEFASNLVIDMTLRTPERPPIAKGKAEPKGHTKRQSTPHLPSAGFASFTSSMEQFYDGAAKGVFEDDSSLGSKHDSYVGSNNISYDSKNDSYVGSYGGSYDSQNDSYVGSNNGSYDSKNDSYVGSYGGSYDSKNDSYVGSYGGSYDSKNDSYVGSYGGSYDSKNDSYVGSYGGSYDSKNDSYVGSNNGSYDSQNHI